MMAKEPGMPSPCQMASRVVQTPPPPSPSRSAITTFRPAPASAYVTSDPVPPPPITKTSGCSISRSPGYHCSRPMYAPGDLGEFLARTLPPGPEPREVDVPGVRPAAVLVPVIDVDGEPRLVFTERTTTLSRHAGEVSFPGGLPEPGEDLAATALREAQ